ncbi:MAG: hypothetical protein Q4E99_01960 [Bacillota bacterium]|nr:hypothetical protein [Bacillota bacterium]
MIIRGKTVFCYDIEVFSNLFTIAVKNSESGIMRHYEISDRQNDLGDIIDLFKHKGIYWCGYNNLHYDDAIINKLLLEGEELILKPVWEINTAIKELSDTIIQSKDSNFSS